MTRRFKFWMTVAVLFLVGNVAAMVMALRGGEMAHAGIHVALALAAAIVVGQVAARRIAISN